MRINHVKQSLAEGKLQLGTGFGQLRSPEIPRLLAAAGFQWAFLDTEHGGFDLETVQDICRVSALCGLSPIVRVADLQYALVARALDCGADGVIFPRVESPELLERAIAWTKFPPAGVRGYGLTATQVEYQPLTFGQIIEHVNANTMVVLQIETRKALEAREELLAVPGIDAVMIGPADLSISLGVPGDFQHPRMVERHGSRARQLQPPRHCARHADALARPGAFLERAGHALSRMQQRDRHAVRARRGTGEGVGVKQMA